MCVKAKCKCVFASAGWRRRPTGRLTVCPHFVLLHPALPSLISTPASPSMPGAHIQPGTHFWLCLRIFPWPVTSSNLANTNLTSNNRRCGAARRFRCAPLHLGPLCLPPLPTPPLQLAAFCMPGSRFTRITSRHTSSLTHASTHSLICDPVFISKHSSGVVCSRRGIVCWLLLKRSSNSAYQI